MDELENKTIDFHYTNTFHEDSQERGYGVLVKVDYRSKKELDSEKSSYIKDELAKYMNNYFDYQTDDIVDIVDNIRVITFDINESKLDVTISNENGGAYVYYKNGAVDSCGAYYQDYDDEVVVYNNREGVDIRYKKTGVHLKSKEQLTTINNELYDLYMTVIILNTMTKKNRESIAKNKTRKLENTTGN